MDNQRNRKIKEIEDKLNKITKKEIENLKNIPLKNTILNIFNDNLKDAKLQYLVTYLKDLNFYWDDRIPTACVGSGIFLFNPKFFIILTDNQKMMIIIHEIFHIAFKHVQRCKKYKYNPNMWNIATDYVINLILDKHKFDVKGAGGLLDYKFIGMDSEEVYKILMKRKKKIEQKLLNNISNESNNGKDNESGENEQKENQSKNNENIENSKYENIDKVIENSLKGGNPTKHITEEELEEILKEVAKENGLDIESKEVKEKIDKELKELKSKIRSVGDEEGRKEILLTTLHDRNIHRYEDFRDVFHKYLADPENTRIRNYKRPSRRKSGNLILKGSPKDTKKGNRLKHLTYALDVSGSISERDIRRFHQSIKEIKKSLNPKFLTILTFNTKITCEKTYTDKEDYEDLVVRGSGGTSLYPVFNRAKELNTEALVVFTDLEVAIPKKPNYDVIWFIPYKECHVQKDLYGSINVIPDV